jgi:hypothetical protein
MVFPSAPEESEEKDDRQWNAEQPEKKSASEAHGYSPFEECYACSSNWKATKLVPRFRGRVVAKPTPENIFC